MKSGQQVQPQAIPGYQTLTLLHQGPQLEHFSAVSEKDGQAVRLCVVRPQTPPEMAARFAELSRACLSLRQPNLLRHLAVGMSAEGQCFLATEVPLGESLPTVLARGPLEADDLGLLATQLCEALDTLHQAGVTFGDLRPESITLAQDAAVAQLGSPAVSALSSSGTEYRAPERLQGRPATPQTDLFSLGAVLHTCLTGHAPFDGQTKDSKPSPLPASAAHWAPVLERTLAWDPSARFSTARELATDLSLTTDTQAPSRPAASGPSGAFPVPRTVSEGDSLGNYKLQRLLGEGAMGQVYLAQHAMLGRQVAIKILKPEQYRSAEFIRRFFQEARSVNQINHEHIVEIFDFVEEKGADGLKSVYCVMEFLNGETLSKKLQQGSLGIRRSLGIVAQVCEALAAAHKVGVVHRDVKPDNIFITERSGLRDYVKVLDFGVAKLTNLAGETQVVETMSGAIVGTPTYMSPEQISGREVDHRADIWAVGVLLYQTLKGHVPFRATHFGALAGQIINDAPPPLGQETHGGERIQKELAAIIEQCLEKEASRRPQSMDELRRLIAPFAATEAERYERQPGRSRTVAFSLVGLAAVGVGIVGAVKMRSAEKPVETVAAVAVPAPSPPAPLPPPPPVEKQPEPVAAPAPAPAPAPIPVKTEARERASGPLTMKEISTAISRSKGTILKCFERHRTELPSASGTVTVALVIEPAGEVSASKVATPGIEVGPLADCIVKEAKRVRFPRHGGPSVTINVPFSYAVEAPAADSDNR